MVRWGRQNTMTHRPTSPGRGAARLACRVNVASRKAVPLLLHCSAHDEVNVVGIFSGVRDLDVALRQLREVIPVMER